MGDVFILEGAAEGTFAPTAGAGRISPLDHETRDDPMENDSVIIPVFRQRDEVFHRFRRFFREEPYSDITVIGMDHGDGITLFRHLELGLIRVRRTSGQTQQQNNSKYHCTNSFHGSIQLLTQPVLVIKRSMAA